jgi:hypothetical protein
MSEAVLISKQEGLNYSRTDICKCNALRVAQKRNCWPLKNDEVLA